MTANTCHTPGCTRPQHPALIEVCCEQCWRGHGHSASCDAATTGDPVREPKEAP